MRAQKIKLDGSRITYVKCDTGGCGVVRECGSAYWRSENVLPGWLYMKPTRYDLHSYDLCPSCVRASVELSQRGPTPPGDER
jgi:hypothetical protein